MIGSCRAIKNTSRNIVPE